MKEVKQLLTEVNKKIRDTNNRIQSLLPYGYIWKGNHVVKQYEGSRQSK